MPLTPVTKQMAKKRPRPPPPCDDQSDVGTPTKSRDAADADPASPTPGVHASPTDGDPQMEARAPLPVTVVTFGHNTPSGRDFVELANSTDFELWDCRDAMPRNPSTTVTADDGSSPLTQISVFEQEHYGEFIAQVFEHIVENDDTLIALGCHSGKHRADVSGRHCVDLLNSLTDEAGHRIFNAMHFKIGKMVPKHEVQKELIASQQWSTKPWCLVATVQPHIEAMYGYEAAVRRPSAYEHWLVPLQSRNSMFPWLVLVPRSTLHSFPNDRRRASTDLPTEYWVGVGGWRWWRGDIGRDIGGGGGGRTI
jgi:hypothetical protein